MNPITVNVIIWPTNPDVPIPAPAALFVILRIHVETGPVIADAKVGGTSIHGFFNIFGTWSIEVPIPCAKRPAIPFSLKLITANPIIWAQHPAVAAPAASPERSIIIHRAADEIGAVRTSPTTTEMNIPNQNGWSSQAKIISLPSFIINHPTRGPTSFAVIPPTIRVTAGVIIISSFVSFETAFPNSTAIRTAINAPAGPPAIFIPKPIKDAPICPTIILEKSTRGGALSEWATAPPIAGPIIDIAVVPISIKNEINRWDSVSPGILHICWPIVFKMSPIKSDEKSPSPIADKASCAYLFVFISISFLFKNIERLFFFSIKTPFSINFIFLAFVIWSL